MPMFMIFLYSSLCHHNKNEVLVLNVIMICFLVYVLVNKVHNEILTESLTNRSFRVLGHQCVLTFMSH